MGFSIVTAEPVVDFEIVTVRRFEIRTAEGYLVACYGSKKRARRALRKLRDREGGRS